MLANVETFVTVQTILLEDRTFASFLIFEKEFDSG